MPIRSEITNGFWVGIGFALAVLVWGSLQMLLNRGRH
jgi:Na+-translocating ferredoxin:NAD+ oxidoreductase RnfE subunit